MYPEFVHTYWYEWESDGIGIFSTTNGAADGGGGLNWAVVLVCVVLLVPF